MAENSGGTARRKSPGRPFLPGQTGNSGGRPKGIAALARSVTHDGADLVRFVAGVFRGHAFKGAKGEMVRPGLKERMEAATWLADRGFGKPTQAVEISGAEGEALEVRVRAAEGLSDGELRRLKAMAEKVGDEAGSG